MKIIFLNALEGQLDTINQFITTQSSDTDIFCFQESRSNQESTVFCQNLLPQFDLICADKYFSEKNKFNQATFVKKNIKIIDTQTIGQKEKEIGLSLFTQIKNKSKTINICNVHGIAWPGDKQDNPDRIKQSQSILDFFKNLTGPKIIGGDFNLDFNTKSVQMFEDNGFKNLIKEFKIPTTRNEVSWSKHKNKQLFADFLFVSPDIKIKKFTVPKTIVSDHQPMILEFEV
jgi:endonuclease/exonuclease/phosphatase (EEP) superfamily protein YafD